MGIKCNKMEIERHNKTLLSRPLSARVLHVYFQIAAVVLGLKTRVFLKSLLMFPNTILK